MKRLKRCRAFFQGVAVTLVTLLLVSTASAAASGQVSINQAGVRLFGESLTKAGDSIQAPNGQKIPSVITYTDATGGKNPYLPIQQLSELLDIAVAWNDENKTVDIATYNGKPSATIQIIGDGENMTVTPAEGVEVTVVTEPIERPSKPEYGVTHGAYQEIDPAEVDTSRKPTRINLQNTRIAADDIGVPTMLYNFDPLCGKHVLLEITNNGDTEQIVKVSRLTTVAASPYETFTSVSLAPGATLTRAFAVSEDSSRFERNLLFNVDPARLGDGTDITISLNQYE